MSHCARTNHEEERVDESDYTTALLHYCTTALLHYCTTALLHYCTTALLHYCTTALLHYCTTALLHYCTTALLHYCTTALLHYCKYIAIIILIYKHCYDSIAIVSRITNNEDTSRRMGELENVVLMVSVSEIPRHWDSLPILSGSCLIVPSVHRSMFLLCLKLFSSSGTGDCCWRVPVLVSGGGDCCYSVHVLVSGSGDCC